MDISRRLFLGGVISAASVVAIPIVRAMPPLPIIYGNGDDDDAAGLEAFLSGKPVDILADASRFVSGRGVLVTGGRFYLSRGLIINNPTPILISNNFFELGPNCTAPAFQFDGPASVALVGCMTDRSIIPTQFKLSVT